ncbi:Alginate biosynthesis protein AlgA [bacterium HR09]|nr:Alginate biosynthesis protein AlgA [bacterium HR09]
MSSFSVKAVILAGGSGTRFWPFSRSSLPKQLLPLVEGRSLLRMTVDRVLPLCGREGVTVVTGQGIAEAVRQELPELSPEQFLIEPCGRDTAAAVAWAAWRELAAGRNPVLLVLPADHWVGDGEAFRRVLSAAAELAVESGGLVTVGIVPTLPETGYGYLELAEETGERNSVRCFRVRRFVEKPYLEKALAFLAAGCYRWNAGIFAFTAQALAEAVWKHLPELARGLDAMLADSRHRGETGAVAHHYPSLPRISIDYGVMEKADNLWAVDGAFPWHDVGSFASFAEILPRGEAGVSLGPVVAVETQDCVVLSRGPLVATLGVRGLVVVATEDAVLVATVENAQKVKALVAELEKRGLSHLL